MVINTCKNCFRWTGGFHFCANCNRIVMNNLIQTTRCRNGRKRQVAFGLWPIFPAEISYNKTLGAYECYHLTRMSVLNDTEFGFSFFTFCMHFSRTGSIKRCLFLVLWFLALSAICVKCLKQTLELSMHLRLKNRFRIGVPTKQTANVYESMSYVDLDTPYATQWLTSS